MKCAIGRIPLLYVVNRFAFVSVVEHQNHVRSIVGKKRVEMHLDGMEETLTVEKDNIGSEFIMYVVNVEKLIVRKQFSSI
jgi:hypothetical protein